MKSPKTFAELVGGLIDIIALIIPLIFALTFIVVVWKIINAWILHADEPTSIEEGKRTAFTGVIVIVIMSGIWGILEILQRSLL